MESLAPVLVDEMELLVDLLPDDTTVLVLDPERARTRAHDLVATSEEFLGASWAAAASGGQSPIDLGAASYREVGDVREHAIERRLGVVDASAPSASRRPRTPVSTSTSWSAPSGRGRWRSSRPRPTAATSSGRSPTSAAGSPTATASTVVHPGHGPAERMVEVLGRARRRRPACRRRRRRPTRRRHRHHRLRSIHGLRRPGDAGRRAHRRGPVGPEGLHPRHAQDAGAPQEADRPARAQGRRLRRPRAARRRPLRRDEAARGGRARPASTSSSSTAPPSGARPPDRLFVPADTLDQVTRYVGGEQPSLDRLGGADWTKRKNRARKAVREIAAELIKLYAARQATQGHAFGPDTPWQRELEDAFPFHETPDQLTHRRRGQGRHAAHRPDGPAGLRRRRLRQDRDRGAGGVQGGAGRQAGGRAGADDAARDPAPRARSPSG